jgi:hypothetical protein
MTGSRILLRSLVLCAMLSGLQPPHRVWAADDRPDSDKPGEQKPVEANKRQVEAGLFSYVPPAGWTVRDFPGFKFKICADQPKNNFAANLNVVDEAVPVEMAEYRKATLANMPQLLKEFKVLSDTDFKTDSGLQGARIAYQQTFNGKALQQIAYIFHNKAKGTFYILTGTSLPEDAKELEATFDAAARSFRLEQ